jgi:hypothetical protein
VLGVVTDLVRGDVFYWRELMGAALIASVPVAIAYTCSSTASSPVTCSPEVPRLI